MRHFQTEPGQYSLLEKLMLLTCITTLISNAVILIIGSVVAILALLAFRSQF